MSDSPLPPEVSHQAPPPAPAAARQTSALAIVSLVMGLLGWTLLPFVGSLVAIVCGHMARAEIRRNPATMEGDGLAVAGLVLGWALVAVCLLTILAVLMFFGGLAVLLGALGMSGQL
jgi:hypothetical protein